MVGDPADGLLIWKLSNSAKKADVAQVHTENGHFGGMHHSAARRMVPSPPSTTTISVFFFGTAGVLLPNSGASILSMIVTSKLARLNLLDGFFDHRAAFTQTRMRHHHRMSGTDHRKPFRITGAPCEVPLPASVVEQMNE